jgi:hypothetical protein
MSAALPQGVADGTRKVPAGHGLIWILAAWRLTEGYRGLFVALVLGFMVLAMIASLIPLVGSVVTALLMPVFQAGLMLGCDALRRGEPLKVDHLFAGFQSEAGRLVGLGAISVAAGFLMLLVSAAIVGPGFLSVMLAGAPPDPAAFMGIILRAMLAVLIVMALSLPLYMALWFAVPLITLHGLEIVAAMKRSFAACLHNMLPFLVWSVVLLLAGLVITLPLWIGIALHSTLLIFVALLPLIVGCIVLAALAFASIYTSYRDIFVVGDREAAVAG